MAVINEIVENETEESELEELKDSLIENAIDNIAAKGIDVIFVKDREAYEKAVKGDFQKKIFLYEDEDGNEHPIEELLFYVTDKNLIRRYYEMTGINLVDITLG